MLFQPLLKNQNSLFVLLARLRKSVAYKKTMHHFVHKYLSSLYFAGFVCKHNLIYFAIFQIYIQFPFGREIIAEGRVTPWCKPSDPLVLLSGLSLMEESPSTILPVSSVRCCEGYYGKSFQLATTLLLSACLFY